MPDDYEVLSQFAKALPAGGHAPAYPFTSIVINLNCATKVHRDVKDFAFCLVLVLSDNDCQGGDLCFVEPGIRLQLRSGDIVLFRSSEFTHYNMHFKGIRASVVLHTDLSSQSWLEDRNKWDGSKFMKVSRI